MKHPAIDPLSPRMFLIMAAAAGMLLVLPASAQEEGYDDTPAGEDGTVPAPPKSVGPDQPYTDPLGDEEETSDSVIPGMYDPEGRRDPFRPLIGPGRLALDVGEKCEGELRCINLQEVKLVGILRTVTGNWCTLQGGPQGVGFFAKEGDKLKNGFVYRIDAESGVVTIREEIDDKRHLKPYRDWQWSLVREGEGSAPAKPARG